MADQERTDFSIFTHPRVMFAERVVNAGGVDVYLDQNEFKTSRDMLVDYVWVSESTHGVTTGQGDPGANTCVLQDIWLNWAVTDRAWWFPQDVVPCVYLGSHWDADRSMTPFGQIFGSSGMPAAPATYYYRANPQFMWRHALRWLYNPTQGVVVNWNIPASATAIGWSLDTGLGFNAVGLKTGHRRIFQQPWTFPNTVANVPQLGTASVPATAFVLGDEPFLTETTHVPSLTFAGSAGVTPDIRWFNQWRFQVKPTWADAWSDVALPMLLYGAQTNVANRDVWYKPPGGPLLLKAGQSVNFRVRNTGNTNTNVQMALVGRVAYGLGSMY